MSDEESFVILGSTPTPSMEAYSSINGAINQSVNLTVTDNVCVEQPSECFSVQSSWPNQTTELPIKPVSINGEVKVATQIETKDDESLTASSKKDMSILERPSRENTPTNKCSLNETPSMCHSSLPESLADKYLLGKIERSDMKMYMSNMFPNLFGKESPQEDVQKLQQLIIDHEVYKNQLLKMNRKLEFLIDVIQVGNEKHLQEMEKLKIDKDVQQKDFESQIAALKLGYEELKNENIELRQKISEGKSVMSNIGAHVERLELQQNDMSLINATPTADQPVLQITTVTNDTSVRIKELERKLSELLAENLEIKDMKRGYVDEIDCLQVNLTSAKELLNQAQADISYLKTKDIENIEKFTQHDAETAKMKQEIALLKHQLEVYRNDFEIERNARQELAGEKDRLLTDLKLLQRRNQQLTEENEKRSSPSVASGSPISRDTIPHTPSPLERNYVCPICNKTFRSLPPLELHVQNCLTN